MPRKPNPNKIPTRQISVSVRADVVEHLESMQWSKKRMLPDLVRDILTDAAVADGLVIGDGHGSKDAATK